MKSLKLTLFKGQVNFQEEYVLLLLDLVGGFNPFEKY